MLITLLKSKLHSARITELELHYEGSIFIDESLLKAANILPNERVEIYNVNNGNRFATYAVPVKEKGKVGLNGAAARMAMKGDKVIICTYAQFKVDEARLYKPNVVLLDEDNNIVK